MLLTGCASLQVSGNSPGRVPQIPESIAEVADKECLQQMRHDVCKWLEDMDTLDRKLEVMK